MLSNPHHGKGEATRQMEDIRGGRCSGKLVIDCINVTSLEKNGQADSRVTFSVHGLKSC